MPRKPRVDIAGYYHIINRGVNRENVFPENSDKEEFINILKESSEIYHFIIHAFCIMDNHYHLLLQNTHDNLSLSLRHINSKYAIYFNKKNNRSGHLWQGRFKSWYVYDESYLFSVVKYIEHNPLRAKIATDVGQYRFASSYYLSKGAMPDFLKDSLLAHGLDISILNKPFLDEEGKALENIHAARYDKKEKELVRRKKQPLEQYFAGRKEDVRDRMIAEAFFAGYRQSEIADYLKLSSVAICKIIKKEKQKREFFERLKRKGLLWSYANNTEFRDFSETIFIETGLKYADFDDLKIMFSLIPTTKLRKIWQKRVLPDMRFKKLNYFLAKIFFNYPIEKVSADRLINERYDKLRMLASQN